MESNTTYDAIARFADGSWTTYGARVYESWGYIRLGRRTIDSTCFVETEFQTSFFAVNIGFMGTDMYQDIRLESITAIKIYVSDEEFGETLCTDDEKLVYVVDDLPQTSDSYQVS